MSKTLTSKEAEELFHRLPNRVKNRLHQHFSEKSVSVQYLLDNFDSFFRDEWSLGKKSKLLSFRILSKHFEKPQQTKTAEPSYLIYFRNFSVLREEFESAERNHLVECTCECGEVFFVRKSRVLLNKVVGCKRCRKMPLYLKFGSLILLHHLEDGIELCRCDCGRFLQTRTKALHQGNVTECDLCHSEILTQAIYSDDSFHLPKVWIRHTKAPSGTLRKQYFNSGDKFGSRTLAKYLGRVHLRTGNRHRFWSYHCDCGKIGVSYEEKFIRLKTASCPHRNLEAENLLQKRCDELKKSGSLLYYSSFQQAALLRCSCGELTFRSRNWLLTSSKEPLCKTCRKKQASLVRLKKYDLTGKTIGAFKVIRKVPPASEKYQKFQHWECQCRCGKTRVFTTSQMPHLPKTCGSC